jgi:FAD/FMN-containing dehydrogenase
VTGPVVVRDEGVRRSFARDASGLELVPDGVVRARDAAEVAACLAEASATGTPVTTAGGQTSTTGASITDRGLVLSLRALERPLEVDHVAGRARAGAGVSVAALKRACAEAGWLLPLDPTSEEECTVGGAVACNATGARSLRYGDTRRHVRGLTVALVTGEVLRFTRPALEKNTVGYHFAQDPVDWFVGSEGTLGVILEVEFALVPLPAAVTGLAIPFTGEREALAFVAAAREDAALAPRCLEYFDAQALEIVRGHEGGGGWGRGAAAMVYAEREAGAGGVVDLDPWLARVEAMGGRAEDILVFEGEGALREARRLRHAVPATLNERGARCRARGGRKVSTDWAVPYRALADVLERSRALAARHGVEPAVVFGHAGNGHPHQNYIARDADELERAERAVGATLQEVLRLGGTVAAEHGIGKLKRRWVPLQLSPPQLDAMRALKQRLDPDGLLAPGNVFP